MNTTRRYLITATTFLLSISLTLPALAGADPRSMAINRLPVLGLEIWTEAVPAWHTSTEQYKGRPVFTARTPLYYYPPASMSWTTLRFDLGSGEALSSLFSTALEEAKKNYQVAASTQVKPVSAQYGPLIGLEGRFSGKNDDENVDVLFFVGQQPGKPAVVMQTLTLPGKLPHVRYQIERSWQYLKYID